MWNLSPPLFMLFFKLNFNLAVAHSFLSRPLFAAVSVVLKERRSKDSVTLAWQGPERPNGAIVEYEVIYYEKVKNRRPHKHTHDHTHNVI